MKKKESTGDRFVMVYLQGDGFSSGVPCNIIVDRVTGVNYLRTHIGHGGGLAPLLDANGKPIVTPVENL